MNARFPHSPGAPVSSPLAGAPNQPDMGIPNAALIDLLLHPTLGLLRGIMTDVGPGKGGPDRDDKLVGISVGELRDADKALRELVGFVAELRQ